MSIVDLLGTSLKSKAGDVETATALKGKAVVALYFSAHWCPPCRGFTPVLADKYKALVGDGKAFEVVFVSSDKDEASFDEYYAEQPWLALPFGSRDVKAALSKKYKVSGIPSLVLLDGDGAIITKDGRRPPLVPTHRRYTVHHRPAPPRRRSAVMEGDFPFTPPTFWDCLGDEFLMQDGDAAEVSQLKGEGKVIVLYFSAHWCPPCRGFTPELVKTVGKLKAAGKAFEIIFVSSDRDQKSFQEYFGSMGPHFLAIPQGDPRKAKLSSFFGVEGSRIACFDEVSTAAPHLWLRCEQASRR